MSTDVRTQLEELAVIITTRVADMLANASKDLEPLKRQQILGMLEEQLPTVVVNTLFRTEALHTPKGIDHLRENIEDYSNQFCQMLIKND